MPLPGPEGGGEMVMDVVLLCGGPLVLKPRPVVADPISCPFLSVFHVLNYFSAVLDSL